MERERESTCFPAKHHVRRDVGLAHESCAAVTRYLLNGVDVVDSSYWEATRLVDDSPSLSMSISWDGMEFSVFPYDHYALTHAFFSFPFLFSLTSILSRDYYTNSIFLVLFFFPLKYSER